MGGWDEKDSVESGWVGCCVGGPAISDVGRKRREQGRQEAKRDGMVSRME